MKTVKAFSELCDTLYKQVNKANQYFVFQAGMECLVRILLLWATVLSWTKVNGCSRSRSCVTESQTSFDVPTKTAKN